MRRWPGKTSGRRRGRCGRLWWRPTGTWSGCGRGSWRAPVTIGRWMWRWRRWGGRAGCWRLSWRRGCRVRRRVRGGSVVHGVFGAQPPHRGERPVDGAQHLPDADLRRWAGKDVAAVDTAQPAHQVGAAQVGQDRFEELARHGLVVGERLRGDGCRVGGGQAESGTDGVVAACGDLHGDHHANTGAPRVMGSLLPWRLSRPDAVSVTARAAGDVQLDAWPVPA